jgi:hypothetical protein
MNRGRIKALALVFLMGGMFSPNQALGKWDLSDAQVHEPECLNCCLSTEFLDQCNAPAEKSYLKSFFAFRSGYVILPALGLAVLISLVKRHRLNIKDVGELMLAVPFLLKNVKQILSTIRARFEKVTEKPEGIVLVVRAQEDWNYGLSSPYLMNLNKKYVVLYYSAEDISDVTDAIKSAQARFKLPIKALVWAAHGGILPEKHGSETKIFFGSQTIGSSNIHQLIHPFSMLDKACVIIVASCLSAFGENSEVLSQGNIAQLLASVADGRKVYSTADLATPFFDIDSESLVPHFNSALSIPLSVFEWLSFFTIDIEKALDLRRCYVAFPHGKVQRC